MAAKRFYYFGGFRFDPAGESLSREGEPLEQLSELRFRLLYHLVKNRGRVIYRKELEELLWPNDQGDRRWRLAQLIGEVRELLRDEEPYQFIKTIRGRGYLFTDDVTVITESPPTFKPPRRSMRRTDIDKHFDESSGVREWDFTEPFGEEIARNRVRYQLYKLYNRNANRYDRGKWYDPSSLPGKERDEFKTKFNRHLETYKRVEGHQNLPINRHAFWDDTTNGYWIIDNWIDGETLDELCKKAPLPSDLVLYVMRGIAEGLKALHSVGVVRRDLAPKNIIIERSTNRVVLTDFETAKFLSGARSVSPDDEWLDNPFRAPEATGPRREIHKHIDLYSWAAVLVYASARQVPKYTGGWGNLLETVADKLPIEVVDIAKVCLGYADQRPRDIERVIRALTPTLQRATEKLRRFMRGRDARTHK